MVSGFLFYIQMLLFTIIFPWFMCFDVLYDFKYFIAIYTFFPQFANEIYNLFPRHIITFPSLYKYYSCYTFIIAD